MKSIIIIVLLLMIQGSLFGQIRIKTENIENEMFLNSLDAYLDSIAYFDKTTNEKIHPPRFVVVEFKSVSYEQDYVYFNDNSYGGKNISEFTYIAYLVAGMLPYDSKEKRPNYYFIRKNSTILVYTGFESLFKKKKSFPRRYIQRTVAKLWESSPPYQISYKDGKLKIFKLPD